MACWNSLSEAQQIHLIEKGYLEFGYRPEGDGCERPAEVALETEVDAAPGPRFYCRPCAIVFLGGVERPLHHHMEEDPEVEPLD